MLSSQSNRAYPWVLAAAALAGLLIVLTVLRWGGLGPAESQLPETDSPTYREMVSAFQTGVAALIVDTHDQAKSSLSRATELVPEEPAAWANRGLLAIRLRDYEAAEADLQRARSLAPENGAIERLLGLLESQRGDSEAAIEHLRRAIERDSRDLRARFELAQEIERRGGQDAEAEPLRLLGTILEGAPGNPAVLLERARLAAKAGDSETLHDTVERLARVAAGWSPQALEQFDALRTATAGGDPRRIAPRILVLRNLLVTDPAFQRSLAVIQGPVGTIGEPLEHFLKLPMPEPTPSAPDEALSFDVKPLAEGRFDTLLTAWLREEGPPAVLAASKGEVRRVDAEGPSLPFPAGAESAAPGPSGILAVDWNSDYAVDLVLAGGGGIRFFQQGEDGAFSDVTEATGLPSDVLGVEARGAWAADIDQDGDLDLVIGAPDGSPPVLQNHGDGTFGVIRPFEAVWPRSPSSRRLDDVRSGLSRPNRGVRGLRAFVWADLDQDGLPDAAILENNGSLRILLNERSGRFGERVGLLEFESYRALAVGDLNGDGVMDLLALRDDGVLIQISDEGETWGWKRTEVSGWEGLPDGPARLLVADLDNNGSLDLVVTASTGSRIWLSDAEGKYRPLKAPPGFRALDLADLDGDGLLDLVGLSEKGEAVVASGKGTKDYHWQVIRPRAAKVVGDGRINAFGIGGEVQVRAGLLVQKQVIDGPALHFGLGTYPGSDVARVVWPNGTMQAEFAAKADQAIVAEQRLKGSCPFVYAFDGEEVRFVTDFLWRSPLGLRINAQETAGVGQTEDRIKIRGDQLAAREGYYDVRITAELWETHYWDHVALLVVDHPESTEVFVDERFARQPPDLAVQATGPLLSLASARDDRGRDVTEIVRERDGRYLDGFGRGPYQGVTRDHWVELELGGDIPESDHLILVAQGWVHPTDSSINVAIAQGEHEPPRGLSLEVPNSEGDWIVARPDLGFPAGKNKTILIDLEGVFQPGAPRKLRLRTNLEVFWDALFVAVGEDSTTIRTQRLSAASAELRQHGYSRMTQADASSPELPDYNHLDGRAQRWRDLVGFYTRFGDVAELIGRVDDRYVIANAGDELALRFAAPPAPPEGWRRDFVLIGDGWNKDGDYNTGFSETVLPLPSHDRPNQDSPPGALEDDPVYRRHARDWRTYHTRYITPRRFQDGLGPAQPRPRGDR